MKGMTCKELGGACNLKLMAQSWGDMVLLMARHLKERHPDKEFEFEGNTIRGPDRVVYLSNLFREVRAAPGRNVKAGDVIVVIEEV